MHVRRWGAIMQVKSHVKAGSPKEQHNEPVVRTAKPTPGLKVKSKMKAGTFDVDNDGW